jgi:hypothetical protein
MLQTCITQHPLSMQRPSEVCFSRILLLTSKFTGIGYEQIVSNSTLVPSRDPDAELVLDARGSGR